METIGFIIFGICAIAFYFLPALIATKRKLRAVVAITFVNFFLGWTAIVWFVVLLWAIFKREKPVTFTGKFLTPEGGEVDSSLNAPNEKAFKAQLKDLGWKPIRVQSSEKARTRRRIFNGLMIALMVMPFACPYAVTGFLASEASRMIPILENFKASTGVYPERLEDLGVPFHYNDRGIWGIRYGTNEEGKEFWLACYSITPSPFQLQRVYNSVDKRWTTID